MIRSFHGISASFLAIALAFLDLVPEAHGEIAASDKADVLPAGYSDDFLFFQLTQDQPAQPNEGGLQAGRPSYGISFSKHLADHWIAGVGYRVKSFIRRDERSLSILTFSNHTSRIFRIYHPLYFLVGTEWSYLIPTNRLSLPIVKDPDFGTEIGVGLNSSLWLFLLPRFPIEFRVERWRGTKTNLLHGWESTISLGYSF